jgi:DNA (cytosine-5)-methyltransferase 1
MRFVSLFAGVGGFDLGLELAGHECVGQVEIDKHCQTVLANHWPDVPRHDDVRTANEWADRIGLVGRTDLVCGGFPCQDVSVAGRRAGLAGERTGLFWDALSFASHVEARWVLLENVPGLLTSNQGRDFGTVLAALADAGYVYNEWRVLDSQFFGVPQRRRRVFLIAGVTAPDRRPLLVESEGSVWDSSPLRASGQDVTGTIEGSVAYGFNPTGGTRDIGLKREQSPTIRVGSGVGIPSPPGAVIGFSHNQGLDIQASVDAFPTLRSGGGGMSVLVREEQEGTVGE